MCASEITLSSSGRKFLQNKMNLTTRLLLLILCHHNNCETRSTAPQICGVSRSNTTHTYLILCFTGSLHPAAPHNAHDVNIFKRRVREIVSLSTQGLLRSTMCGSVKGQYLLDIAIEGGCLLEWRLRYGQYTYTPFNI